MRIFFFLAACMASAIMTILNPPEGSYYSIYITPAGLLYFVHTGQKKKKCKQLEESHKEDLTQRVQCMLLHGKHAPNDSPWLPKVLLYWS